jgi:asparagine synthase (glutamine-hydrolysing)
VAREASKQVKVVLSGEGADELFAGYRIYQEPLFLRPLASLPELLKKVLKRLAHLLPDRLKGKSYLLRGCTPLEKRYVGNAKLFEETEKANLLIQYCPCSHYQRVTKTLYEEAKHQGYDPVTTMQYIDINTWLVGDILVKADRMSMAHSLELRVPYLDQQVFEVAAEVHPRLKVTRQTSKWLLRQALKGVVPDHVINRPKLGFPVPIRHWLKNEWYEWARQLILESDTHHLLNKQMVLQMLDAHRKGFFDTGGQRWTSSKGRQDYSRQLWAVITFILWHQIFVEQRYAWARPGLEKESVGHRKANAL